jgi:hypothetical protein
MDGQGCRVEAVGRSVIRYGDGLDRMVRTDEHRVLLTLDDGVPVARVRIPDPGRIGPALERSLLDPHADGHRSSFELRERMRRRLGVSESELARPTEEVPFATPVLNQFHAIRPEKTNGTKRCTPRWITREKTTTRTASCASWRTSGQAQPSSVKRWSDATSRAARCVTHRDYRAHPAPKDKPVTGF